LEIGIGIEMVTEIKNLKEQLVIDTIDYSAEKLLKYLLARFGDKIALATSFGAEDQVLTDMLCRAGKSPMIFTLDTGRLHEETYKVAEATRKKYDIKIKVLFPDSKQIEKMTQQHGFNLFYDSIEKRKLCCKVRKLEPLKKQLSTLDAWICGLRSEQSPTRTGLNVIDWDQGFGLIKICPLSTWSQEQVWEYIRKNDVPYNKLHAEGFPSIGCEPCTRAVRPGEDIRGGRWWWEEPEHKECGLHAKKGANYQI